LGYHDTVVARMPDSAIEAFAGVGNPFSQGALGLGERVVDLGSGGGFDCFIAAEQVGAEGQVIGVDMTEEMLQRSRATATAMSLRNVEFRQGIIEDLPIPGVLVTMNVVYAASAYPFGRLSDAVSRRMLLVLGVAFLIAADIVLATAGTAWQVFVGVVLWGLHMGATQGLLSTLVVDAAPADLRGTALGMFNLVTGGALLAASALAGWLWTEFSPAATFTAGAVFAGIALLGMLSRGFSLKAPNGRVPP
jgi:MFS family permease